jgi:hypothetical protein
MTGPVERPAQCMLRGQRDQPRLCQTPAKESADQMQVTRTDTVVYYELCARCGKFLLYWPTGRQYYHAIWRPSKGSCDIKLSLL